MKRSLRKAYVIAFLRLTIGAPTLARGMEPMPQYLQYFQEPHGANYGINRSLINIAQKMRTIALLTYYRAKHAKNDLNQPIELIRNQLAEFKTQLLQEEYDILIAIKNKYAVSDEIWQRCMTDIQELKAVYNDSMQRIWPGIKHDKNIPADLLELLKATLVRNGINPNSINIRMVTDQEEIDRNKQTNAQAVEWINSLHNDYDKSFSITKKYIPSAIEIFPRMKDASTENKISTSAHEVQHIAQQHGLTKLVVTKYLSHYYRIEEEAFFNSGEHDQLVHNHEVQAEILSAIAEPHIAESLKAYRYRTYYPGYLYEEHYYNLATIDMLWKLNSWLTFLHKDGITNGISIKAHNFAQSCKQLLALH